MIAGSRPLLRPRPGEAVPSSPLEQSVKDALAGPLRKRTLILISHSCPYFLEQLTSEEQELYAQLAPATVRALERVGVSALDIGPSLSTRHYCDAVHLTAEGGRRMAETAAPKIRAMARRLGYVTAGQRGPEGK